MQENEKLIKKYFEAKRLRPYKTCALMLDLRGRAIMTSEFQDTEEEIVSYAHGDEIEVRTDGFDVQSRKEELQINYFDLPSVMREGDQVTLGDNG